MGFGKHQQMVSTLEIGTLSKQDGNATTAKTIRLKYVIVKKVCLLLSMV